jgi:hypothetical protein
VPEAGELRAPHISAIFTGLMMRSGWFRFLAKAAYGKSQAINQLKAPKLPYGQLNSLLL